MSDFRKPVRRLSAIQSHILASCACASQPVAKEVSLIVGGGPGVSASCARLFAAEGMVVAIAARNPEKPVMQELAKSHNVHCYNCDASNPDQVAELFVTVSHELGDPRLVVHNIDGRSADIFRKSITDADSAAVLSVLIGSAYSAFLVGQQAAKSMQSASDDAHKGTIIFTNASAAFKGFPKSGAFAMASHGKSGLAQSMARELWPQGIHVAHVPIDAAIGRIQPDKTRGHWLAGSTVDDNMVDPDEVAKLYLSIHRQQRSTWSYEMIVRPWIENW